MADLYKWPAAPDAAFCTALARGLPTSILIRIVGDPVCLAEACDPDGELQRSADQPGRDGQVARELARETLAARARLLVTAATAEIDRRIPIPEGR